MGQVHDCNKYAFAYEVINVLTGGKCGCRRCHVSGTYIPAKRHYYYYGDFRRRFTHREELRTVGYHLDKGKQCDEA